MRGEASAFLQPSFFFRFGLFSCRLALPFEDRGSTADQITIWLSFFGIALLSMTRRGAIDMIYPDSRFPCFLGVVISRLCSLLIPVDR